MTKLSDPGDCETNAMTLAVEHTTIPVPSILRVIHPLKCPPGWRFIVIRYIPGRTLEECWATLSWWRRAVVLWTLRRYVRQLRKVPLGDSPPVRLGMVPRFATVLFSLKCTYVLAYPRQEMTISR